MRLVWWVQNAHTIVERPIDGTVLPPVAVGKSVAHYELHDTCHLSGQTGLVTKTTFDSAIDAYNAADDLRVKRMDWLDSEIKRLTEEFNKMDAEIEEVPYHETIARLAENERARLLKEVEPPIGRDV